MGLAEIRTAIKEILEAADPDATVHDYERWANTEDAIKALYEPSGAGQYRAWVFRLARIAETADHQLGSQIVYRLDGRYFETQDDASASQKTVIDQVEVVRAAIRTNHTLNGAAFTTITPQEAGLQVDQLGFVMIGATMCAVADWHLSAVLMADA